MAPPPKISEAERVLHGRMAATMHAGTFGRLLEVLTEERIPEIELPRPHLTEYGRTVLQGYFAGMTHQEIRDTRSDLSPKQHQRRRREICDQYGARTSMHLIRRVVEVEGSDWLPARRIPYTNQKELARILSPRQVVYWGLLSYGIDHRTIERIFDVARRTVDRTVEDTKADLHLPHNTTEFVIAQFFADGVLKPDQTYLPHEYVVESLTVIRYAMRNAVVPPECLPEGPYPRELNRA